VWFLSSGWSCWWFGALFSCVAWTCCVSCTNCRVKRISLPSDWPFTFTVSLHRALHIIVCFNNIHENCSCRGCSYIHACRWIQRTYFDHCTKSRFWVVSVVSYPYKYFISHADFITGLVLGLTFYANSRLTQPKEFSAYNFGNGQGARGSVGINLLPTPSIVLFVESRNTTSKIV